MCRRSAGGGGVCDFGDWGVFAGESGDAGEGGRLCALLSKAHVARGEFSEGLAAAIDSVEAKEIDPANPAQNNISEYYRIGMMAQYDVGDFATARKYYGLFLRDYPRDLRAFNVKRMLQHLDATAAALRAGTRVPTIEELPPPPTTLPVDSGGTFVSRVTIFIAGGDFAGGVYMGGVDNWVAADGRSAGGEDGVAGGALAVGGGGAGGV